MLNDLVSITDQKAVTTSLIVAEAFEKRHDNVMRVISRLECSDEFRRLNFEGASYIDEQGKPRPMSNVTREGLLIVERITGIDLSDVVQLPATDKAFVRWLATCSHNADTQTPAADLYGSFCTWYRANMPGDLPSQKWFGLNLGAFGYQRKRTNTGRMCYQGITLN